MRSECKTFVLRSSQYSTVLSVFFVEEPFTQFETGRRAYKTFAAKQECALIEGHAKQEMLGILQSKSAQAPTIAHWGTGSLDLLHPAP